MINNLPRLNPEQYAQKYAQENNVSINQARAQLESQYGAPQAPQGPQGMQGSQGVQGPQGFQGPQAPQMPQQFQGGGNAYAGMDIFDKMDILNQHFNQQEMTTGQAEQMPQSNPFLDFIHQLFTQFAQGPQGENSNNDNNKKEQTIEAEKKDTTATSKKEKQDPDTMAKEYMEQYNKDNPDDTITLKEAKELLKEQYGAPDQK